MRIALEFTLTISPCMGCSFCPQEKLAASYGDGARKMSMADFESILAKLPKECEIHFSGMSECFLHPEAPQMMAKAKSLGFEVHLYTTLMGLTPSGAFILPKQISARIHVPDIKAFKVPDKKWIEQHEIWRSTKIRASYMAMDNPTSEVGAYLASKKIEVELPAMLSRGGNLPQIERMAIAGPIRCTADRWHQNVVLPNGLVVGCCMDYATSVRLGNLLADSYSDIQEEAEFWRSNMVKDASGTICSKCEWAAPL